MPTTKKATKRTALKNASGSHYVRRREDGTIKTEVKKGRATATDRRTRAKTRVAKGQGDRGDV